MTKRIIIACAAIALILILIFFAIGPTPSSYHHKLIADVSVNGESLDLQGIQVNYDLGLAHTEPPMGQNLCGVLEYNDGSFCTEFSTKEYWNYRFEFTLPSELTGFATDITVCVGENDAIAWEYGTVDIDLDLTVSEGDMADAVMNINRIYIDRKAAVMQGRTVEKQLTPDDSLIESVIIGQLWEYGE